MVSSSMLWWGVMGEIMRSVATPWVQVMAETLSEWFENFYYSVSSIKKFKEKIITDNKDNDNTHIA